MIRGPSKSSPIVLGSRDKAQQCLELRKSGMSWTEIGKQGIYSNKGTAYRAVMDLLGRTETEMGDDLRTLENFRLDKLLAAIWDKAMAGDLKAIDRALRISQQRARLYGIEAPVKTEVTGADGGPIEVVELEGFVARLAALPDPRANSVEVVELFPDREAAP